MAGLEDESEVVCEAEPEDSSGCGGRLDSVECPGEGGRRSPRVSPGPEGNLKSCNAGPMLWPASRLGSRGGCVPVVGDNDEDLFRDCPGPGKC